jgi:hypothetical protein
MKGREAIPCLFVARWVRCHRITATIPITRRMPSTVKSPARAEMSVANRLMGKDGQRSENLRASPYDKERAEHTSRTASEHPIPSPFTKVRAEEQIQ